MRANAPDPLTVREAWGGMVALLVWAAATGAALVFVLLLGSNVPYYDEWELVPFATGHQPLTLKYLWSLHNEHRIPLPRLVYLGLMWLSDGDFRSGMVGNVLLMSAASLLLMLAVRRIRGRFSWTDGALPLALLHPGHAENFLASFQLQMALSTFFVCLILAAIAVQDYYLSRLQAVSVGFALLMLPLCGANGVVLNPFLGVWLAWAAFRSKSGDRPKDEASRGLLVGLAAAALSLAGLYMIGYQPVAGHPKSPGLLPALASTGAFLTNTFGPASGQHWMLSIGAVVILLIASVGTLVRQWWKAPPERPQVESLIALLTALGALAFAVGLGRSGFGVTAALAPRYALLAAPILCEVYVIFVRYPGGGWGRTVPAFLFAVYLWAYPVNLAAGTDLGVTRQEGLLALTRDIEQGMPLDVTAGRHIVTVYPDPNVLFSGLNMLRDRHFGPFSHRDAIRRFTNKFPFLGGPLIQVRDGLVPATLGWVAYRPVLVAHVNSDLVFDVLPGSRRASGTYGVMPDSYRDPAPAGGPQPDGTWFAVVFSDDQGKETTLFSRLLFPQRRPEDRGMMEFEVTLPQVGGKLTLEARMGPPGVESNGYADWAYWQGVSIR